jgi:hypothetical protein
MGVAFMHSALVRQATQPVPIRQSGLPVIWVQLAELVMVVEQTTQVFVPLHTEAVAEVQSMLVAHWAQEPAARHTGVVELMAAHSVLLMHPRQAYMVESQTGIVAVPHSLLLKH